MEDPDSSEYKSGKMNWVLDSGLRVGKKMLVAGCVLSSAPLLIPPLVVISSFAFVSSIPYSVFFASYACTEKLMSKLLPPLHYEEEKQNLMGGTEQSLRFREGVASAFGSYDDSSENRDEVCVGNVQAGAYLEPESFENYEELDEENVTAGAYFEPRNFENFKEDEEAGAYSGPQSSENFEVKVCFEPQYVENHEEVNDENVCAVLDIEADGETGRITEEIVSKVADVVIELYEGNAIEEDEELVAETTGLLERIRDECKADNVEDNVSTESMYGSPVDRDDETLEREEETGIAFDDVKRGEDLKVDDATMAETGREKLREAIAVSEKAKVSFNEAKVWEQMNAMRRIVGYEGTRNKTCVEELKALYLFMGVEPPASIKEASDIVELNHSLYFLMSIVGVK